MHKGSKPSLDSDSRNTGPCVRKVSKLLCGGFYIFLRRLAAVLQLVVADLSLNLSRRTDNKGSGAESPCFW